MGFDSIWTKEGEWLKPGSKDFRARSTGCSCCSIELETEEAVKKEVLDTLANIVRAADYFEWAYLDLIDEAKKIVEKQNDG